jgi:hypothetical protein
LGFHAVDDVDGTRILERADLRVAVRDTEVLEGDALEGLLHDAKVSVTVFLEYLSALEAHPGPEGDVTLKM